MTARTTPEQLSSVPRIVGSLAIAVCLAPSLIANDFTTAGLSADEVVGRMLEIAIHTAIARRGVAVFVIPGDVALPRLLFAEPKPTVYPSDDDLSLLAEVLNRSKKTTILGGAGCAGARSELVQLARSYRLRSCMLSAAGSSLSTATRLMWV